MMPFLRSFPAILLSTLALAPSIHSEVHSLSLLGKVTTLQSINGALENRIRLNDPYVLTLGYDPDAEVDHDSNSGDARNNIDLSITLDPVHIDSPIWIASMLNQPEGALIIENNSIATTGTALDSLRALVTLEDFSSTFPSDTESADPQFGTIEVEVGGRFVSEVDRLPTTLEMIQFLESAVAEVSLNGDYLVGFTFDRLTANSKVEGQSDELDVPNVVLNQVFKSGTTYYASLGTSDSLAGAGYRLESSLNLEDWTPRHLFVGTGSPLTSRFSYGGGNFFRIVSNGAELALLADEDRPRD
ncbi:hypothetical protein AAFN60_00970 [Roseibacillus persicicus]|uniref:hypothetical protein n=1 Tax=Roseibacillus persicicus TaxID=454148 RepID=UPI00398B4D83